MAAVCRCIRAFSFVSNVALRKRRKDVLPSLSSSVLLGISVVSGNLKNYFDLLTVRQSVLFSSYVAQLFFAIAMHESCDVELTNLAGQFQFLFRLPLICL